MVKLKYVLVLCYQIMAISTAPLQLQYQSQLSLQPTQEELLQQLFALQQFQNSQVMNEWTNYYPPSMIQKQAPPMMILLPESQISGWAHINNELNSPNDFLAKTNQAKDKETDNGDLDSVVVEAETELDPQPEPMPKKAILLIPNTRRFSIGGIISAIPFLPIEVNVPDTISWIYDGISGIISGIGNRFPIKKPVQTPQEENNNVRLLINKLQNRSPNVKAPILMLPDVAQVYPMPVPMRF